MFLTSKCSFSVKQTVWLILIFVFSSQAYASVNRSDVSQEVFSLVDALESQCETEENCLFGLATYLDSIKVFHSLDGNIKSIEPTSWQGNGELLLVGRKEVTAVRLAKAQNLQAGSSDNNAGSLSYEVSTKKDFYESNADAAQLKYSHLWRPLALIAQGLESLLTTIHNIAGVSWGWALVFFAITVKILLLPLSLLTARLQEKTISVQSQLQPMLQEIKTKYKGEEAHNRIMAAHKELGVSPFYTLKPSIGFFVQVPVFIAIFNMLGEMPQFSGESFLWIKDLAYPDAVFPLGFSVPWLGNTFNLTPFLMAVVAVISAMTYRLEHIDAQTLKAKRKQLIYMGLVFLVLFFPFPAAMTFYWFMANVLQMVEQNLRGKLHG